MRKIIFSGLIIGTLVLSFVEDVRLDRQDIAMRDSGKTIIALGR